MKKIYSYSSCPNVPNVFSIDLSKVIYVSALNNKLDGKECFNFFIMFQDSSSVNFTEISSKKEDIDYLTKLHSEIIFDYASF